MKNILCVSHSIDFGNITLENNLKNLFENDFDFYTFNKLDLNKRKTIIKQTSLLNRGILSLNLRKTLKKYSDKTILFNSIGPMTWAYGSYKMKNSILMIDWTRTLRNFFYKKKIKKDIAYILQSHILKKIPKILCRTDSIIENLATCYGVKNSQMQRIPAPLNTEFFNIPPRPTPNKPRVLFIGVDFERKGGPVLINNLDLILSKFDLTIATKDKKADVKGVNFINNFLYASPLHKKILSNHDIFIFPSKFDPYGMVIAEAASAGMAIITTKGTLSSEELIQNETSGIIVNEPKDCISALLRLAENPSLIDKFKHNIYKETHLNFSKERLKEIYLKIINN